MDIFAFLEEFWIFLEEKRVLWPFGGILSLLEAFQMVLWVFDGNMVGKWTNEPCNGADEVVNPFWVLTGGEPWRIIFVREDEGLHL